MKSATVARICAQWRPGMPMVFQRHQAQWLEYRLQVRLMPMYDSFFPQEYLINGQW